VKLLYVTHGGGSGKRGLPSGATRVAVDLATGHSSGFEPVVVFLGQDGGGTIGAVEALDAHGIRHHAVEWRGSNNLRAMISAQVRLYRIIRAERPEVVCLNAVPATYLGWLPSRMARVPLVLDAVHLVPSDGNERAMARFLRLADHLAFVSPGLQEYYTKLGYGRSGSVIQNGIQLQRFRDLTGRGLRTAPFCISMVARLQPPHKDPVTLLRAFALLRERGYPVRLRFVGDGPGRSEVEALAAELGVAKEVEITGYTDRVAELLNETDIFALATRWEGQPLSVMEAMAVGLPIVASNVIGVTDVVEDRKTGLMVPPEDPEAMAGAIEWLLDHREEALAMGENARIKAEREYDATRMAKQYEELILRLRANRAHRA